MYTNMEDLRYEAGLLGEFYPKLQLRIEKWVLPATGFTSFVLLAKRVVYKKRGVKKGVWLLRGRTKGELLLMMKGLCEFNNALKG